MARRPEVDRRQADFFGAPASTPRTPKPKPGQAAKRGSPSPDGKDELVGASIDVVAARLSPAELKELVAALPDDALACLIIATARQLRRRLVRSGGPGGSTRDSVLERAARQLIAELGGQDEGDDSWYLGSMEPNDAFLPQPTTCSG